MPSRKRIIIATPHRRNDALVDELRTRLPELEIIRIERPEDLSVERLRELSPEWLFFPHWSWIIPREIHENFRCVMFHMTDVPFGRGGSPLQNLIVRGHRDTKLTALRCTAELDAGPVYLKVPLSLSGTAEEILTRAAELMPEMIMTIVTKSPPSEPVPQSGEPTTFKRRTPKDSNVATVGSLVQLFDRIRMLDGEGYPRAFLEVGKMRLELSSPSLHDAEIHATVTIRMRP